MIQHVGEAIVLRTWPFHEADLLVSLFTREQGRVKGVARHAMRSRKRFGGALEPMTHVRATYAEKPRQELVRLDAFEILSSPMSRPVDYARCAEEAGLARGDGVVFGGERWGDLQGRSQAREYGAVGGVCGTGGEDVSRGGGGAGRGEVGGGG